MESLLRLKNIFKGDKVIWIIFFLLCITSIVEVYSASSTLGFKSGNYWKQPLYHFTILMIGITIMIPVLNLPCKYFKSIGKILFPFSFGLLILVLIIGTKENGAARWLKIGPIPIQPSEIAKGVMIIMTARILSGMQTEEGAAPKAFYNILKTCAFLIVPIIPENLSTAVLLFSVVVMMMIIGRVPLKQLGGLASVCVLSVGVILAVIFSVGETKDKDKLLLEEENHIEDDSSYAQLHKSKEKKGTFYFLTHRCDTWKNRILDHFNKDYIPPEQYDLYNKDAQEGHAKIAIVSSNITGVGPGNSEERDYLSQAFSDFIYAIIIEETGIEGAAFVAFLYICLLFRTGMIARKCLNPFPAYLAMGLALLMATQALFNMGVAVGLFPVTGQPLPLISKGGTSSIINCLYIATILSISRTAAKREENTDNEEEKLTPSPAIIK